MIGEPIPGPVCARHSRAPIFLTKALRIAYRPHLAIDFLRRRILGDKFVEEYLKFVERAAHNPHIFRTFKTHPSYRAVLEHVSKEEGAEYLKIIQRDAPDFLAAAEKFNINDEIGSPRKYIYPIAGAISPTTLRYMKVASDLRKHFGTGLGDGVVEIGVGYGGQLLIIDRIFSVREYCLIDLPPVLELVQRYLECHTLNCSYRTATLDRISGDSYYDLALSNYAFSELPYQLQLKYIDKVLSKAARGYLTMNSGRDVRDSSKLTVDRLRELLPPFEVLEEDPLTFPGNYLIVWGMSKHSAR